MIQKGCRLNVIDNSGASRVECIHVKRKGKNRGYAVVGDLIRVSIKRLRRSIPKKRVKKGETTTALLVSTKMGVRRQNGVSVRSRNNHVVLLNRDMTHILTNRIALPLFLELRKFGFAKLVSIAPRII